MVHSLVGAVRSPAEAVLVLAHAPFLVVVVHGSLLVVVVDSLDLVEYLWLVRILDFVGVHLVEELRIRVGRHAGPDMRAAEVRMEVVVRDIG